MALQHLRSGTANKRPVPTAMSDGQLAVNTNLASPGLFFKDSNGDLVKAGPVHVGSTAPNASPASTAATALVANTVYQILTIGTSDFTAVGASANTVGVVFTASGTTTGTGTVSGQQGNEKGEQWLDTTNSLYVMKVYDGTGWRVTDSISLANGTAAAPSLHFGSDTNTGVFSPAGDKVAITTAGTQRVVVDASGKLGLGTSSPQNVLSIAASGVNPAYLHSTNGSSGAGATDGVVIGLGDATNVFYWNYEAGAHVWATSGTERMRIDSSGRLGLGTSSPQQTLHLKGTYLRIDDAAQNLGTMHIGAESGVNSFYSQAANGGAGAQPLRFMIGSSTEAMRLDSSGRLLVGLTTGSGEPIAAFQGRSNAASDSGIVAISRTGTNPSGSIGEIRFATGSNLDKQYATILCQSDGSTTSTSLPGLLRFNTTASGATSPTERMRIDSSGRLLINHTADTAPAGYSSKLQLCDTSYEGASILIRRDQNNGSAPALLFAKTRSSSKGGSTAIQNGDLCGQIIWYVGDGTDANSQVAFMQAAVDGTPGSNDTPGRLEFHTTADGASLSTERMRIDSSGRLMLGTVASGFANSAHNFTIADPSGGNCGMTIRAGSSSSASSIYFADGTSGSANYEGFIDYQHSVNALRLGTGGGQERMRIDSSGSLQIAKTAFTSHNTNGHTLNHAGWVHHCASNLSVMYLNRNNSNGNIAEFYVSNSYIGNIHYNGTTCTFNSVSDYRLKENVVDIADGIARVKQLSPRRFNFIKNADATVDGFIAHEAQAVVPEAVCGEKDGEQMQGIDQSKLVPLLTAALQEAIAKIETLETKVAALEAG